MVIAGLYDVLDACSYFDEFWNPQAPQKYLHTSGTSYVLAKILIFSKFLILSYTYGVSDVCRYFWGAFGFKNSQV